jgi:hypothetical protein
MNIKNSVGCKSQGTYLEICVHVPTLISRDGPYRVGTLNMGPEILRYGATNIAFSKPHTNGKYKMSRYFRMCFTAVTVEANNPFITNNNCRLYKISVSKLFTNASS